MWRMFFLARVVFFALIAREASLALAADAAAPGPSRRELVNRAYRMIAAIVEGEVSVRLEDKVAGMMVADGPCLYRAVRRTDTGSTEAQRLEAPSLSLDHDRLTIRGRLAGLAMEHILTLPTDRPLLEERITVRNGSIAPVALTDFEAGMTRSVADKAGRVLPDLDDNRMVAVPFRYRSTSVGHYDYSFADLVTKPGQTMRMNNNQGPVYTPSRHRWSEGWAWTHGRHSLGIFSFNQDNMVFSVLSTVVSDEGTSLRLGGAVMLEGEPAALGRIAPGQSVDLGLVRYQTVEGGYADAMLAYRRLLDEHGCRFPEGYNPPVHWEQLYDMNGAWTDRLHKYTKAIIESQAAKGRDYSCEAIYLDPGWDTEFGTFLWGERWLGPRKQFIDQMQSKYGLKVSLHCPLATWMSHQWSWGIGAVETWPKAARRQEPAESREQLLAPAVREGCRNLALLPAARPKASSVYDHGKNALHQVPHLNDGWCGNAASWIAGSLPAWAEIDLGAAHEIAKVCLGNDRGLEYKDRAATELNILVATDYNASSAATSWRKVAQYRGPGIPTEQVLAFPPVTARWVRVELLKSAAEGDMPRLDEIEIYEARPVDKAEADSFTKGVRRRARPLPGPAVNPMVCLGSKQYLEAAAERLLANCADGVAFLMFDGNWWNGGCSDPAHGHAVPYRMEDHIRANLDLAQRVHAKYPKVLIEMHDMLAGGSGYRPTPIYYKYGLPGSYDENWGFELMWDVLKDVKEGRAAMLYYANMGCNVPIYLHVNVAQDNAELLGLWWYASTCRHLGIGGTHADPKIVAAQQSAMRYYRRFDRFFKRGEFYGTSEEVHLHVLPEEKAFVVNVFNLSGRTRTVSGQIDLRKMGLDPALTYRSSEKWGTVEDGVFRVSLEMPPWSARVADVQGQ